jgi:hypothetical protein
MAEEITDYVDQARIVLEGHACAVECLAITPDGKTILSGSENDTIEAWDLCTGERRSTFGRHKTTGKSRQETRLMCLAISPDGKYVAAGFLGNTKDETIAVWEMNTGERSSNLMGHSPGVCSISFSPNGKFIVTGSADSTIKVWDFRAGLCLATLNGHNQPVSCLAFTPDGRSFVSGSYDRTIKIWDRHTGVGRAMMKGHGDAVCAVAITPDGDVIVSASADKTIKIWDRHTGVRRAILEGHRGPVLAMAITPDGGTIISGSTDNTLKVWDLKTGSCGSTLKGHTDGVYCLSMAPNGKTIVSGSHDKTIRVWDLPDFAAGAYAATGTQYTNAKVVLVGESGVGKSGLAMRLCEDRWEATESTHGMIVNRLELPADAGPAGTEREVWLWDFAGQPDYRLIHQLYMDETALAVLVFDPQDDNPFENLGYWEKALRAAGKYDPAKLLVAARCDRGGITISAKRFDEYVKEHNLAGFLTTGAKSGEGCDDLKTAIAKHIPWDRMPWTATSRVFKTLKDAILKQTEGDTPLVRLAELRTRLELQLHEEKVDEADLRAVAGLMQGQGVIQAIAFGDFLLLQPEWINRYASVVVRMAREHADEMGAVPEQTVLDGKLDFKDMKRLPEPDERILLRAMVQTFLDRSLCLRELTAKRTLLVFPSYFRRDKPDLPGHPSVFVTYGFSGPLDEIYATLVVRLSYSDGFTVDQLWKDAADFRTQDDKRVGLAMKKKPEGAAEMLVYFDPAVTDDAKVTFIKYVHEHLLARAEDVTRVRHYVCPKCAEPVESLRAVSKALERGLKTIPCQYCNKPIPLFDLIEQKFASTKALQEVRQLDERAGVNLDNQSRELILVGHAIAIAAEAGQIFRPVTWADWGIDGEIEFKNRLGQASGKRVYLQLKSGDSYLRLRGRDEKEIFRVEPRWAEYWLAHAYPVMLVIRTSDGKIRWMNVTEYLQKHGKDVKQIEFEGEAFTAESVASLMRTVLKS